MLRRSCLPGAVARLLFQAPGFGRSGGNSRARVAAIDEKKVSIGPV